DSVNEAVAEFLIDRGFNCVNYLSGKEHGTDVTAEKLGWSIWVESKGSKKNSSDDDLVFDSGQIKVHTGQQILKLMELANTQKQNVIFVMANPDLKRIRDRIGRVNQSLNKLGFVQFWVKEDKTIIVDYTNELKEILEYLDILRA
ncbi:hypothetical protein NIE32_13435, partial [Sporolactobacillus kofuensis]